MTSRYTRQAGGLAAVALALTLTACNDADPAAPAAPAGSSAPVVSSSASPSSSSPAGQASSPASDESVNPGPPPSVMSHMATQPTEGPSTR